LKKKKENWKIFFSRNDYFWYFDFTEQFSPCGVLAEPKRQNTSEATGG
jgi:hypothetical protein